MDRAVNIKSTLLFLLIAITLLNSGFIKKIKTPETLFLDASDGKTHPSYQKVLTAPKSSLEQAKWKYLLERVKHSPQVFVRNGETFGGEKAARHLLWKTTRGGRVIKNAHDFIDKIASKSFSSGSPYLMKVSEKETHPLRDVLLNELRRLELYLAEDRK